ncbi:hypothetical protein [Pumilibacter intestinalis]|uniref:hypothetical protein n=1 Tax=Pumilibacter intestinalis TaxID=2941511 RepID=UPI00203F70B2|nr:hypothetical protein [Pumilibacter intestinalis]
MAEEKGIARQNINSVTAEEKERRLAALKACRGFSLKSFLPTSENCHFERYNFACGKEKLSVVYDTKAQMLTLTAQAELLERSAKAMKPKPPLHKKKVKPQNPKPQKKVPPPQEKVSASVMRKLRKLLPDAFDLLGEQSKTDLGIGMTDIGNENVKLSDYSVLLVPPYRGLERFIYDLQQAREITVKMIGQAYEKNDSGRHVLKQCYRKKNGIVYSEVMSALYVEYFEKRNFYAHSDNSLSGASRVINDKAAAKKIFDGLCEIINYNAKKLKETGFTISPEKN